MSKFKKNEEESTTLPIEDLVSSTIEKIKSMIDSDIVVGKNINLDGGRAVMPLSRVSVGFVAGGGEYEKEKENQRFPYAGGSGAGFSVTPIGLIVIDKEEVKYLKVSQNEPILKLLDILPEAIKSLKKEHKDD